MEEECRPTLNTGLRGVVIADTRISDVQGFTEAISFRIWQTRLRLKR
jgi:hypothetical protein